MFDVLPESAHAQADVFGGFFWLGLVFNAVIIEMYLARVHDKRVTSQKVS